MTHLPPAFPSFTHAGMYQYMNDLLQLDACHPRVPMRLPPHMENVHCPLLWREWDRSMASHLDQRFWVYIVDGLHESSNEKLH